MNSTKKSGYTLIEMLVTMSVLAFLASFVVPTYQLILSQFQLTSSANEVADFLRLTEQKTVTEQSIYGVTFLVNGASIPQYLYNPADGSKTTKSTYTFPSWIKITQVNFSTNTDIRFATSGAPNVSGNIVITDTIRNRNRKIEIRPSGEIFANSGEF